MKTLRAVGLLITLVPAVSAPAFAEPAFGAPKDFEFIEGPAWKESDKALPDYPKEEDLLPLDIDSPSSSLDFFIDAATLALTEDGIVSYTVVMRSDSGANNVLREGIRCATVSYKTQAYGNLDNTLQAAKEPVWQSIGKAGVNAYRNELFLHYVCDGGLPRKPDEIVQRVKTIESRQTNTHPRDR